MTVWTKITCASEPPDNVRVTRGTGDVLGLEVNEGDRSAYIHLSPKKARKLAKALKKAARKVENR